MLFKPAAYFRSSLFLPSYHRTGAGAGGIADTAVLVLSNWWLFCNNLVWVADTGVWNWWLFCNNWAWVADTGGHAHG